MKKAKLVRVLFVCLGNICRSPMAEAVFRHMVNEAGLLSMIEVASAGTGGWHAGEPPHHGTILELQKHNIAIGNKKARQLNRSDLKEYDYIIAMDEENVSDVQALFGIKIHRLLDFAPEQSLKNIPDPYYSGGFNTVYQLVNTGSKALLEFIRKKENI